MNTTATVPARLPALVAISGAAAMSLGLLTSAPAWAHDTLIGASPEEGEVLEQSPEEILLEFSGAGLTTGENITNAIWVTDEQGEHWEGEVEVEGSTMSTELPEELPNGEYEVLYRVVYSDGHSEEMAYSFEVDAIDDDDEVDVSPVEEIESPTPTEETEPAEAELSADPRDDEPAVNTRALGLGALVLVAVVGVTIWGVRRKRSERG